MNNTDAGKLLLAMLRLEKTKSYFAQNDYVGLLGYIKSSLHQLEREIGLGNDTEVYGTLVTQILRAAPTFMEKLEYIPNAGFYGLKKDSLSIPASIAKIEADAFMLSKVTEIDGCTGLTLIAPRAFANMTGLITIDLSDSKLETIPEDAFYNCTNLRYVKLPPTIRRLSHNAFPDIQDLVVDLGELDPHMIPRIPKDPKDRKFYKRILKFTISSNDTNMQVDSEADSSENIE